MFDLKHDTMPYIKRKGHNLCLYQEREISFVQLNVDGNKERFINVTTDMPMKVTDVHVSKNASRIYIFYSVEMEYRKKMYIAKLPVHWFHNEKVFE